MATIGELLVLLGVNSAPLTAGLAKSDAELKGFGSSVSKTSSSAAAGFHAIGIASLAVSGGLIAFGAVAAKQASAFQSAMELIRPVPVERRPKSQRCRAPSSASPRRSGLVLTSWLPGSTTSSRRGSEARRRSTS